MMLFSKMFFLKLFVPILIIGIIIIISVRDIPFISVEKEKVPWSIGIYTGPSPLSLNDNPNIKNPVLSSTDVTDINAEFVADPFMIKRDNTWYMFFEAMNAKTKQGDIAVANSVNGVEWTYNKVVLDEPFHLSFPNVFESDGKFYMIPESAEAGSIRIYEANSFPESWTYKKDIIKGKFVDNAILHYDNTWWLFTTKPWPNSTQLFIYYSDNLTGEWVPHPMNPVANYDPDGARLAGNIIEFKDKLIRYTQDAYPRYGSAVRTYEIKILSKTDYKEERIGPKHIINASNKVWTQSWNARGMHQVDPHMLPDNTWIAAVDGIGMKKKIIFDLEK